MAPKLPEKQRLKLIERVVKGGESVSKVCREAGISRVLFYRWLKRYKQGEGLGPKKPAKRRSSRRVKDDQVLKIVALVLEEPKRSSHKISQQLPIGNHGVQNVLKRLDLNVANKRLAFAGKAKELTEEKALKLATEAVEARRELRAEKAIGLVKLSPMKRLEMIEQVVKYGKPVAAACRDFGVSRPTFYKWLARYQEAEVEEKAIRLTDKAREVKRYVGQVAEEYERLILNIVVEHPDYGIRRILKALPQLEGKPVVGYHGVQNVLKRSNLSVYALRQAYAEVRGKPEPEAAPAMAWLTNRIKLVWDKFVPSLAPAPPPTPAKERGKRFLRYFFSSLIVTVILGVGVSAWVEMIGGASSASQGTGLVFASIALTMGSIFFLYSLKYYLTLAVVLSYSQREMVGGRGDESGRRGPLWSWLLGGNGKKGSGKDGHQGPIGLEPDLKSIRLKRKPMVSVQIPFYNEKKVVERAIEAATSFDYPSYEVMLLDDSTDETPEMIKKYQQKLAKGKRLKKTRGEGWTLTEVEIRKGVYLKHLHRTSRQGFKGGALGQAAKLMDERAEFVVVFDADFVPYPDTLELFLKYFKAQNQMKEDYKQSNVAVVQGYQWHVLNKSENWITRGVRSEYAGSYVIERSGEEIYGGLKQISGSVYMMRRDVLDELGWQTSITEDFQLTLRLYEKGYKVVYTPYIQAPAECVSTLRRLIRQRMRWAEGHSQNIKKMFARLMRSDKLTIPEKLETIYLSPYYLQAFFFLVGTLSWLMAETVFPARLPFWTVLWGWSLVLTNMISLPLMNAAGMFLEESEERDYLGLASFIALSYILVPFQAYAAFKGFLEKEEGPWFRTPKTGKITDVLKRGTFYRFIAGIMPGRPATEAAEAKLSGLITGQPAFMNKYMALATANNRFDSFRIRPKRMRWVGKTVLSVLLAVTVSIYHMTYKVSEVYSSDPPSPTNPFALDSTDSLVLTSGFTSWQLTDNSWSTVDSTTGTTPGKNIADIFQFIPGTNHAVPGVPSTTPTGKGWIWDTPFGGADGQIADGNWTFKVCSGDSDTDNKGDGYLRVLTWKVSISSNVINTSTQFFDTGTACDGVAELWTGSGVATPIDRSCTLDPTGGPYNFDATENYFYAELWDVMLDTQNDATDTQSLYVGDASGEVGCTKPILDPPAVTIPEYVIMVIFVVPFLPILAQWLRKRRLAKVRERLISGEKGERNRLWPWSRGPG